MFICHKHVSQIFVAFNVTVTISGKQKPLKNGGTEA